MAITYAEVLEQLVHNRALGTGGSGDYTSNATSSLTAGRLLVMSVDIDMQQAGLQIGDIPTPTSTGVTWQLAASAFCTGVDGSAGCAVWVADTPSGGGTITITQSGADTEWDTAVSGLALHVLEVAGAPSASALIAAINKVENVNNSGGSSRNIGAGTITLPSAPASTSIVLHTAAGDTAVAETGTTPAGYTELLDLNQPGHAGLHAMVAVRDTGSTSTSVAHTDFDVSGLTFDYASIAIEIPEPGATIEQEGFRVRNDDGSETTATWKQAQDTNASSALNTNFRLRTLLNATLDPASFAPTLRYKKSTDSNYVVTPIGPTTTYSDPSVVRSDVAALSTANPSVTFNAAYTPLENDLIILFVSSTTVLGAVANASLPSGWFNPLGDGAEINSDAHGMAVFCHLVTAAEQTAVTLTYTATGALDAAETGRVHGVAVRNVDPAAPIDGFNTAQSSTNAATPHVLAGITGSGVLLANSLVISSVAADGTGTYGSDPAGWTMLQTAGTTQGRWTGTRDTLTSLDTDVTATNITPSAGDEYASITLAIAKRPATNNPVFISTSANVTAGGEATTAQLTAPSGKSTSDFVTGRMWDDENGTDTIDITTDDYTEVEWSLQFQSPAVNDDVYQFRVYQGSNPAATYTVTPEVTVGTASTNLTVADLTVVTVIDTITLTQEHNLTVSDLTVVTQMDTVTLTQDHQLVVSDLTVVTVMDTVTLDVSSTLEVSDLTVVTTIETVALTQEHNIAVSDLTVVTQMDTVTLTQVHQLVVSDLTVVTAIDTVTLVSTDFPHPASISGRKVLDQNGNVYFMRTFSSWKMANKLTNAQITTALEGVAGNGFNGVTVWCGGIEDRAAEGDQYENQAGLPFWATTAGGSTPDTPWAMNSGTELGAAWASVDWIVEECARLEMTLHFSFCAGFGSEGAGPDWEAVTDADMHAVGVALATRYASYPNIVWHVMFDDGTLNNSTRGLRCRALFDGINDTEGTGARPVRWVENNNGDTTSEAGWFGTSLETRFTINSFYEYQDDSVVEVETWYAQSATLDAGNPVPTMDCEPPYDGANHYTGDQGQQLRERSWALVIEGAVGINYGQEDWWPFTGAGIFTEGLDWTDVQAHSHTVQQSYVWALADYYEDTTWAPKAVVSSGETPSADTKAAAGGSDTVLLVYIPTNRSLVVDTTLIAGTGNVRLRWYDPTTGTYPTTIASSEAQNASRSISNPGTNSLGLGDWVLVVDLDQATNLVVSDLTVTTVMDTVTLTQVHQLVVSDLTVVTQMDTVTLTQVHQLVVSDMTVLTVIDTVTLTQVHALAVSDLTVLTTIDTLVLTQAHNIAVSDMTVLSVMDTVTLSEPSDTSFDICVTFGAPVRRHEVGEPLVVARSAGGPELVGHSAGGPVVNEHTAGSPVVVTREAGAVVVADREAGPPTTQDRSTTIVLGHGNPGDPTLKCEE